jgi:hypothetical protein
MSSENVKKIEAAAEEISRVLERLRISEMPAIVALLMVAGKAAQDHGVPRGAFVPMAGEAYDAGAATH